MRVLQRVIFNLKSRANNGLGFTIKITCLLSSVVTIVTSSSQEDNTTEWQPSILFFFQAPPSIKKYGKSLFSTSSCLCQTFNFTIFDLSYVCLSVNPSERCCHQANGNT